MNGCKPVCICVASGAARQWRPATGAIADGTQVHAPSVDRPRHGSRSTLTERVKTSISIRWNLEITATKHRQKHARTQHTHPHRQSSAATHARNNGKHPSGQPMHAGAQPRHQPARENERAPEPPRRWLNARLALKQARTGRTRNGGRSISDAIDPRLTLSFLFSR